MIGSKRIKFISRRAYIFDNEEFLMLAGGQGNIPVKYKDHYLYVKVGRASDSWSASFAASSLQSEFKLEAVKMATH